MTDYVQDTLGLVADKIRMRRLSLGQTQEQVVTKLQGLGLPYTRGALSNIERKVRPIPVPMLIGLAVIWECTVEDLTATARALLEPPKQ